MLFHHITEHIGLFKCHSGVSAFLKSPTDNFFGSFVKIFISFLFLAASQQQKQNKFQEKDVNL